MYVKIWFQNSSKALIYSDIKLVLFFFDIFINHDEKKVIGKMVSPLNVRVLLVLKWLNWS